MKERPRFEPIESWIKTINERWNNLPELEIPPNTLSHLAFIPDGNRTCARIKGLPEESGYVLTLETVKGINHAAKKWGLNNITYWIWSTENWNRDEKTTTTFFDILSREIMTDSFANSFLENRVKFSRIGRDDRIPPNFLHALNFLEERAKNGEINVTFAVDHGGLDEVARAVSRIMDSKSEVSSHSLVDNPSLLFKFLDTAGKDLPDLVIRTASNSIFSHTSGFMSLQTNYSRWLFIEPPFPDITPDILAKTISDYLKLGRYARGVGYSE